MLNIEVLSKLMERKGGSKIMYISHVSTEKTLQYMP